MYMVMARKTFVLRYLLSVDGLSEHEELLFTIYLVPDVSESWKNNAV